MPRPSEFAPEIGDAICDRLIDGESLRSICDDAAMPAKSTVMKWLASGEHQAFVDQYARAREMAGDADADDIGHIARQAARGEIEAAAATAAINGLKWTAARRQPKKYGDKIEHEHSGGVKVTRIELVAPDMPTPAEREALPDIEAFVPDPA